MMNVLRQFDQLRKYWYVLRKSSENSTYSLAYLTLLMRLFVMNGMVLKMLISMCFTVTLTTASAVNGNSVVCTMRCSFFNSQICRYIDNIAHIGLDI
jgi:hypothetical protein